MCNDVAAGTLGYSYSNEATVYSKHSCLKSNWRFLRKYSAKPYARLFRLFAILAFFVSVVGVGVSVSNYMKF